MKRFPTIPIIGARTARSDQGSSESHDGSEHDSLPVKSASMTAFDKNATIIHEDEIAPDFELTADDGRQVKLSDYRGKTVALYFYPMDDTPGCTTEAVNIRDAWAEFVGREVVVLGVSSDDIPSHRAFKDCYALPFSLLSDPQHVVCDLYGTWGMNDRALRSTFLISGSGRVLKTWALVDPAEHARWLLEEIDKQLAHTNN